MGGFERSAIIMKDTTISYPMLGVAVAVAAITSLVGAFYLMAIAFHASWEQLRADFISVYLGILVGVIISTLISRCLPYLLASIAIVFPVGVLIWIAFQNVTYLIDAGVIIALCWIWSNSVAQLSAKNKSAEQVAASDN